MAFDFPTSPSNGQIFSPPGGPSYIWNGTVWNVYAIASGDPGDIKWVSRDTPPSGWLKANGALVSRTTYAALFTAIGTAFGVGDGSTTFALPDLRGEFVRGWDDARGIDVGRAFGTAQAEALATTTTGGESGGHQHYNDFGTGWHSADHSHGSSPAGGFIISAGGGARAGFAAGVNYPTGTATTGVSANHYHGVQGWAGLNNLGHTHSFGSGTETRPRNVALLACIRY